jgi:hypothetical protein
MIKVKIEIRALKMTELNSLLDEAATPSPTRVAASWHSLLPFQQTCYRDFLDISGLDTGLHFKRNPIRLERI